MSVVVVTLGLLVWAAVALVPLLVEQLSQLISASPSLLTAAEQWIDRGQLWALDHGLPADFADLSSDLVPVQSLATQLSQRLLGLLGATVGTTITGDAGAGGFSAAWGGSDRRRSGLVGCRPLEGSGADDPRAHSRLLRRAGGAGVDPQWRSAAGVPTLKIPYGVLFAVLIGFTTLVPYASAVSIVSVSAVLVVQTLHRL